MKRTRLIALFLVANLIFSTVSYAELKEPPGDFDPRYYGRVAVLHWAPSVPTPLNVTPQEAEAYKVKNRSTLSAWIEEAASRGSEWIVTPEMAVTGYPSSDFSTRSELTPYVEPIPGDTTRYFSQVAKRLGVYLHIGLPEIEVSTGAYYNAIAVIDPKGTLIAVHRKVNLYAGEINFFTAGSNPTIYSGPFGITGVAICADIYSRKILAWYRRAGVQGVGLSSSWAVNGGMQDWQEGARNLNAYVLSSNNTYFPDAGVVNPDGSTQSHIRKTHGLAYGFLPRQTQR